MTRALALLLVVAACRAEPAAIALGPDDRVIDRSDDGRAVLVGTKIAAPPDSDATLVHRVVLRIDGAAQPWPVTLPIRNARFVSPRTLVAVDAESQLLLVEPATGNVRVLDAPVEYGLDFSAACGCVAYMRGESPESEPALLELATGVTRTFGESMAPAWQPVLSGDGRELLVVSARSGVPGFWRLPSDGGRAVQLTNAGADPLHLSPFPEGLDRPVWKGDSVSFTNLDGPHTVTLAEPVAPSLPAPRLRGTP